jgi:hypothetical protein
LKRAPNCGEQVAETKPTRIKEAEPALRKLAKEDKPQ